MNKNETIADIRKEAAARFRELLEKHVDRLGHIQAMQQFNQVFDRIEAAWKREREELIDDTKGEMTLIVEKAKSAAEGYADGQSDSIGNAAAMREALVDIDDAVWHKEYKTTLERWIHNKVQAGLSVPPRNCDVGTADEQIERFKKTTQDEYHTLTLEQSLAWAQMTYEESDVTNEQDNHYQW